MLDLNHPDTPITFAVAAEHGKVLHYAKRMTLVSTQERQRLLDEALNACATIRDITKQRWGNARNKVKSVELLETNLRELASTQSTNDYADSWEGCNCDVCDSLIEDLPGYPDMVYCRTCIAVVRPGLDAVDRSYGLWCI